MQASNTSSMSAAERLRLQKEQFVRENTPSGGWERGVHHPLAKWLNYGDKTAIAASLNMTRQSVDNVLHGRISWTPSEGVRGDGKRRILWKTFEFVWQMIVLGAKPPSIQPPSIPPKGEAKPHTHKNQIIV